MMIHKLVNLIFECLHLQRIKHEGFRFAGVQFPDSVAEHSLGAAQIGYILAKMEGADAHQVCAMLVWHDLAETRIGDMHKIAARYLQGKKDAERAVSKEQFAGLSFAEDVEALLAAYETRDTLEGRIAKDADYLQMAFQAKTYLEQGYASAQDWIDNVGNALKTDSAKQLRAHMCETQSTDWRYKEKIKKIPTS